MEHYNTYKILENVELAQGVNLVIKFINNFPVIGRIKGDKYRWFALKRFLYALRPVFRMIFQIVISAIGLFLALILTGTFLTLVDKIFKTSFNSADNVIQAASGGSLAFLSIYLSQDLLANKIINTRPFIKMIYNQWRMNPKSIALSQSFFTELRTAIGRGIAFSLFFKLRNYPQSIIGAFLISFIIMFVSMIMTSVHLYLYDKKGKIFGNTIWYYLLVNIILLIGLIKIKTISFTALLVIFIGLFIIYIKSMTYIFNYDGYEKILGGAHTYNEIRADYARKDNKKYELSDEISLSKDEGFGYEYLNNLIFSRFKKTIINPIVKKQFIIFVILLFAIYYTNKFKVDHDLVEKYLPLVIILASFAMFHHESINQAFFKISDRSLMQYSFYRQESSLLSMYRIRYKKLIKLNIVGILFMIAFLLMSYKIYNINFNLRLLLVVYIIVSGFYFLAFVQGLYFIGQPFNYDGMLLGDKYKRFRTIEGYILFLVLPLLFTNISHMTSWILMLLILYMVIFIMVNTKLIKKYGPSNFILQK